MVTRIKRTEWQPKNGIVVFIGESGEAKDGIAVPIAALPTLASQALRFLAAAQSAQSGLEPRGDWYPVHLAEAQTYDVGLIQTSKGEKVSLAGC